MTAIQLDGIFIASFLLSIQSVAASFIHPIHSHNHRNYIQSVSRCPEWVRWVRIQCAFSFRAACCQSLDWKQQSLVFRPSFPTSIPISWSGVWSRCGLSPFVSGTDYAHWDQMIPQRRSSPECGRQQTRIRIRWNSTRIKPMSPVRCIPPIRSWSDRKYRWWSSSERDWNSWRRRASTSRPNRVSDRRTSAQTQRAPQIEGLRPEKGKWR